MKLVDMLGLGSNSKLIVGSNPSFSMLKYVAQMVEQRAFNLKVLDSNSSILILIIISSRNKKSVCYF